MASAVVPRMAVPGQFESLIVQGIDFGVRREIISAVVREGRPSEYPNIRRVMRELHSIVADSWPEQFGVAV